MCWQAFGKGPPVLWMPYPLAAFVVGDVIPDAFIRSLTSTGHQVITFDPPASGTCTRRPKLTLDEMAECALEALDHFGVRHPVPVAGHSQGAMAAMHLAYSAPSRVGALILVGASASARSYLDAEGALWNRSHPRFLSFALRAGAFAVTRRLAAQKLLFQFVLDRSFVDASLSPQIAMEASDWLKPASPRSGWMSVARTLDLSRSIPRQPALLIAGKHDPQTPFRCTEELLQRMPDARLSLFERSGHYPFLEEPELFRETVRSFLSWAASA